MSGSNNPAAAKAAARAELDALRSEWREALLAARDALKAEEGFLPEEELEVHERHLRNEYATAAAELRRFALDEGLSVELAEPFLPRGRARRALALPKAIEACVFELDDVLVASGALHRHAWARALNELLSAHSETAIGRTIPPEPFDPVRDYAEHIEGLPRLDGVRAFFASRGIRLPEGTPDDPPGAETVNGIANRKSELLGALLEQAGVRAFDGARHYLEVGRDAGLSCAVVSASAHTHEILERSGLADLIAASIDADAIESAHLRNHPAPDRLLAACRALGVDPQRAAAFETSRAGVEAARAANLGYVIAIDPSGDPVRLGKLRLAGANVTVTGLAELIERAG
jgi:beta-phosphoglucomutase-like phosphatase (HAD superfamily)